MIKIYLKNFCYVTLRSQNEVKKRNEHLKFFLKNVNHISIDNLDSNYIRNL